jgi:hypothetical protein
MERTVEGIQRGIQDLENEIAVVKRADLNWPTNVNIAALNNRIAALINERTQLQGKKTVYLNFTHICRVRAFIHAPIHSYCLIVVLHVFGTAASAASPQKSKAL